MAWSRLLLEDESPLTGTGRHSAPSLLFPMEAVFEAFAAKHLAKQLKRPWVLKTQARSHHLVRHRDQNWFRLKPDLLIRDAAGDKMVLDTKWKLLDGLKANGTNKYGLSQSDLYQLQAYGLSYLDAVGRIDGFEGSCAAVRRRSVRASSRIAILRKFPVVLAA